MKAREHMSTDFLSIDARWSPERALTLLTRVLVGWIVVRRREASLSPMYYAIRCDDALPQLESSSAPDVLGALSLDQRPASPTVAAWTSAGREARAQVVIDDDRAVGILPPVPRERKLHAVPLAASAEPKFRSVMGAEARTEVTRDIVADFPAHIFVGEPVSLFVSLAETAKGGVSTSFKGKEGASVDIIVSVIDGFSILGASEATLTITVPQSEEPVRFKLKAEREGAGRVRVRAFMDTDCIAVIELNPQIEGRRETAPDNAMTEEKVSVTVSSHTHPDLSLFVLEKSNELSFYLASADGSFRMQNVGATSIAVNPREHFAHFFKGIESLPLTTDTQRRVAERKIAGQGATLFKSVFPDKLQALLWDYQTRIRTVQITSEEPWIPWEMCRLVRQTSEGVEDGPFLCEAFAVTRWLSAAQGNVERFSLKNVALVVPEDSGLTEAKSEKTFILSLADTKRRVTPITPTFIDVTDAMALGLYDAWHFTGHAEADTTGDANRAAIQLEGGEVLTPEDITGKYANVTKPRPFVFLNACQSGRGGLSLTGIGGWAACFLRTGRLGAGGMVQGASAFVGTHWSVYDDVAAVFAKELYTLLLSGKPIGEAAKEARAKAREKLPGDPTWLAYTVYAEPNARVI